MQPRQKWPTQHENELSTYLEKSSVVNNFLTDKELDTIFIDLFRTFSRYRHYNGGTLKFEKFDTDKYTEILYPKLKLLYPWLNENQYYLSGNGYITATNYALHMDSCNPSLYFDCNQLSVKSFILPLFVCKSQTTPHAEIVFFRNRLFGWECNFSNQVNDVKMTYQKNVDNYNILPWVNEFGKQIELDVNNITDEIYNKHLCHLPRDTYNGMIIENILPFIPGSIILFDPYQPHVTGNNKYSNTKLKGGIRFNITKKFS